MTTQNPIVVQLERLPHRHAVVRLRSAYRQLRQMPTKSDEVKMNTNANQVAQIVQEKKP